MSLDIRYVTNGKTKGYYVNDALNETITVYDKKEDIPKNIRHYATDGEPKFWGPDMARIMGVRDVLYPDFPVCGMPDYDKSTCIAESCKYAVNGDWTKCEYFNR